MKCSVLLFFISIGLVAGAPNNVKAAATVETQYVPKVAVGGAGVSASWGGYSASAGLGGDAGSAKGGLFAAADSPHGRAAAGLGGSAGGLAQGGLFAGAEYPQDNAAIPEVGRYVDESVAAENNVATPEVGGAIGGTVKGGFDTTANTGSSAGSSSSAGAGVVGGVYVTKGVHTTKVVQTQPGFFDRVFNIPISVLQAVNTYLNNKEGPTVRIIKNEELTNLAQQLEVQGIPMNAETLRLMRRAQRKEEKRAARKAKKGRSGGYNLQAPTKRVYVQGGASVTGSGEHIPPVTNVEGEATGGAQTIDSGYGEIPAAAPAAGSTEVSSSGHVYGAAQAGGGLKVVTYEVKPDLRSQVAGSSSADGAIVVQKPIRNYDQIFNIPISALKSVNQLLNG